MLLQNINNIFMTIHFKLDPSLSALIQHTRVKQYILHNKYKLYFVAKCNYIIAKLVKNIQLCLHTLT